MKNSCQKEEINNKKGYVLFFSDPDVIVKRAETTAIVSSSFFYLYKYGHVYMCICMYI